MLFHVGKTSNAARGAGLAALAPIRRRPTSLWTVCYGMSRLPFQEGHHSLCLLGTRDAVARNVLEASWTWESPVA
jgi:hypothetical protein